MDKKRAREHLIKSKLYRFLALVFACVGALLFGIMYFQKSEGGQLFVLLGDPVTVVFLLFPFIPAVVLSYMARSAERKMHDCLKDS